MWIAHAVQECGHGSHCISQCVDHIPVTKNHWITTIGSLTQYRNVDTDHIVLANVWIIFIMVTKNHCITTIGSLMQYRNVDTDHIVLANVWIIFIMVTKNHWITTIGSLMQYRNVDTDHIVYLQYGTLGWIVGSYYNKIIGS